MGSSTIEQRLAFISANVRREREALGWTQTQLAEEIGVDLRYVQTLESGTANPTAQTLIRLGAMPIV